MNDMIYRTVEHDMADAIAHSHGVDVHALLKANPGLAGHGPHLPAGIIVRIPPPPAAPRIRATTRLWD